MTGKNINYERICELLIASGAGGTEGEAAMLFERYNDLSYIIQLDEYTLKKQGLSDKSAHFVRLAAALTSRRITDRYKLGRKYKTEELEKYICGLFFGLPVETVYMLIFDKAERLIGCEYIGEGTVNSSGVLPRKLVDIAMRKEGVSVILAHNHPCGTAHPSSDDSSVTSLISMALQSAGIELRAHYVVSGFELIDCLQELRECEKKNTVV